MNKRYVPKDDVPVEVLDVGKLRVSVRYPSHKGKVVLDFSKIGYSTSAYVSLAEMTIEELDVLQSFVTKAIDSARPYAAERDEQARKDAEDGLPNPRLYRTVPEINRYNWPE